MLTPAIGPNYEGDGINYEPNPELVKIPAGAASA